METPISSAALLRCRKSIQRHPRFIDAIREHYFINDRLYKKQPLFYKVMLQESRLNIVLSMCCFVFGHQASSISDIKALCSRYKIASPNSVIAIVTFLRASGRICTWRSTEDRRKIMIAPTPKGLDELKRYMSGAFGPLKMLYPEANVPLELLDNDDQRHDFFRRAAQYLFRGQTFKKMLPEVGLFIDKDGGRMIMLYLYLKAVDKITSRGVVIDYSASALAKEFFVSRIHVSRIIKEAQATGYLEERDVGSIMIYPSFIQLVENYAGLYFSYFSYYLNLQNFG